MQHECKITVIDKKCFSDYQEKYNDGTRPVIFKIERIDIPENDEEATWLAKQDFSISADDAYTG